MVKWLQEYPDAFGILPFLLYQENDYKNFLYEFTSEHVIGPDGYLAEKGFIPLDDQGRNSARDAALSLAPISR
jgi:hypothetical protein